MEQGHFDDLLGILPPYAIACVALCNALEKDGPNAIHALRSCVRTGRRGDYCERRAEAARAIPPHG